MLRRAVLLIAAVAALTASCKPKPAAPQPFPLPKVPAIISDPGQYMEYLVTHYWNPFFSTEREYPADTALMCGVSQEEFTRAFSNYAALLLTVDTQKGLQTQEYLLSEAEKKAGEDGGRLLAKVLELSDELLYDPNSLWRNEEMYIPVEEARLLSEYTSEQEKARAEALLPALKLNRTGTPAADFSFTLRNGRQMRLSDVKADNTVLLFSNPGCEECKAVITRLQSLEGMEEHIAAGRIAVVNVYPDADLSEWISYAPQYPANWFNGYDHDLAAAGGLYNLRAIPSLYLLDKDKKVIFKDVDAAFLVNYLRQALQ